MGTEPLLPDQYQYRSAPPRSGYDLIGDLHGHADELIQLLEELGYTSRTGTWRHPTRQAIFCGDFIDRGPQIREVLSIVRGMVEQDAALAVIGNHEYNAIAYHTQRTDAHGAYFRPRSPNNQQQHQATLNQLPPHELQQALNWFRTLPIAIDLGFLRVVHACWDPDGISMLQQALNEYGRFSPAFLMYATDAAHPLFWAVERVLKGPELKLPPGMYVRDKQGFSRSRIRIRWFEEPDYHNLSSYALPAADHSELSQLPVTGTVRAVPYGHQEPPLFIGHYWMPDSVPLPLTHNVACLDYSVARDGQLCAYRFDGESRVRPDRFITVPSRSHR